MVRCLASRVCVECVSCGGVVGHLGGSGKQCLSSS